MDLKKKITAIRDELASFGADTTGRGIPVPKGYKCIYDFQAEDYRKLGHHVETRTVLLNGEEIEVTLFSFGDPEVVATRVRTLEHYHKGTGETNPMMGLGEL